MATYFGSRPVSDWQANGPAESGHNFIDQINEQAGKITSQEGEIANQRANADAARNTYNQAYQNQQSYGDLYDIASQKAKVGEREAQYQDSSASVAATNSAMRTLPSSINAGSNVVLTNAQRNAALGNQMNKYQNTLAYQTEKNANDKDMYQTALATASDTTKGMVGEQQARVAQAMQDKQTELNQVNALYDQLLQERAIMRQIYGDMYEDEYRHAQRELEIWADNLQAETARDAEQQANYRARLQLEAQNKAADINKYLSSGYVWDGNQWVKLNQAKVEPYLSTTGNYYTPQTGTGTVKPMTVEGNPNISAYVADPSMMASLAYNR